MMDLKLDLKVRNALADATPIKTINQMWDAAIQYYNDPDNPLNDSEAMYAIHDRMDARLTYQDIANVMIGVYADTYWNGTFMDPAMLAKNMVQGLAIDLNLANQYASGAMSLWSGILVRKNFSDSGTIPITGSYTLSIDVVCNQNTHVPSTDALINNWNNEYWKIPQVDKNYIYVRCQNLNFRGDITNPQIQLFYTEAGFNAPPSSWIQMLTDAKGVKLGNILLLGGKTGPMAEGVRGVSEAFVFTPKTTNHLCLIAAITSDFFTKNDPLKSINSNWDTATWITHNGAAGWHNVDPQKSVESTLKFYNQDSRPEKFAFEAHCNKVPEGTVVALKCNDSKLQCTQSDGIKISRKYQTVSTEAMVPANYQGDLKVLINTPDGKLLPEGASVEVCMTWLLDHSHNRYLDAADMLRANVHSRALREIRVPMGSFTFIGTSNK
jgi:hypothetical protein